MHIQSRQQPWYSLTVVDDEADDTMPLANGCDLRICFFFFFPSRSISLSTAPYLYPVQVDMTTVSRSVPR